MIQTLTHNLPPVAIELVRMCLWLATIAAIFVPLERLFPLHPAKIWREGMGADLGYYFVGGLTSAVLLAFPLGVIAWAAHRTVPYSIQTAFNGASFWTRALSGLVAGEVGYYWGHRMMHELPFLWRFHSIHHSPEHIDFLVSSRVHPIDLGFSRLCAFAPLYVLGLGEPASMGGGTILVLVTLIGRGWSFFIHGNLRWHLGPLAWIVTTPGFHHWHHAMEPANRNYASMLPVLDRIFGTFHMPARQWPPRYGIPGVVPDSWLEQLALPLIGAFPLAPNPTRAEQRVRSTDV